MNAGKDVLGLGLGHNLPEPDLAGVFSAAKEVIDSFISEVKRHETEKHAAAMVLDAEKHLHALEADEMKAWDAFALAFIQGTLPRASTPVMTMTVIDEATVFAKTMIERRRAVFAASLPLQEPSTPQEKK
jgi:hypothetical protein